MTAEALVCGSSTAKGVLGAVGMLEADFFLVISN